MKACPVAYYTNGKVKYIEPIRDEHFRPIEEVGILRNLFENLNVTCLHRLDPDSIVLSLQPVTNIFCGSEAKYWVKVADHKSGYFKKPYFGFYLVIDEDDPYRLEVAFPG